MKSPLQPFLTCLGLFLAGDAFRGAESPRADALASWRIDCFGLFIRWGAFALPGTQIGWSRAEESHSLSEPGMVISVKVYTTCSGRFNPVHFDAKEWAAITWRPA